MKKVTLGVVLALIATAMFLAISCDGGGTTTVQKDCVVMLGDSIFALSGEETEFLEELSGHTYRTYYISGAQMDGGYVDTIPEQYADAKRDDSNIETVIFDGGGNDVLIGEPDACATDSLNEDIEPACYAMIDKVEAINVAFWQDMIDDGVANLVQQGYYETPDQTLWVVAKIFQDRTIAEWNAVAAANPQVKMVYADPRTVFDRADAENYTIYDDIHPTTAASEKLANLLWDTMVAANIDQTDECPSGSSSGGTGGCN